jgi:hypothetical protein
MGFFGLGFCLLVCGVVLLVGWAWNAEYFSRTRRVNQEARCGLNRRDWGREKVSVSKAGGLGAIVG